MLVIGERLPPTPFAGPDNFPRGRMPYRSNALENVGCGAENAALPGDPEVPAPRSAGRGAARSL